MRVAVDDAIPYSQAAFAAAGEIRLFSGRSVRRVDVRDVDALIVRSVTRVDAHLLEGSSVRFVGTATIGMDHLDLAYLRARGIYCANAAGSNANSVAEYVVSALLATAERRGWRLSEKSIGIIGVGRIGTLVAMKAAALGMKVLLCDPPLRESTGDERYGFLDDVLGADILTLHVPLTAEGRYPTLHMVNRKLLRRLSPSQFLINSARGAVVCGTDLLVALRERWIEGSILDVWEGEPRIDRNLLDLVELGTAHIAGYSQDGKALGTAMILDELCRFFGISAVWDRSRIFAPPQRVSPQSGTAGQDAIRSVVLQAYDIRRNDADLRAIVGTPAIVAGERFDRLRDHYPLRPEFSHFIVEPAAGSRLTTVFQALGFEIANPAQHETTRPEA
jgi:erythronate-4-phosphate dehydrogenase